MAFYGFELVRKSNGSRVQGSISFRRASDQSPGWAEESALVGLLPPNEERVVIRRGRGKRAAAEICVGLTDQTLSCAARAHVATAERHAACLHLNCAMLAA